MTDLRVLLGDDGMRPVYDAAAAIFSSIPSAKARQAEHAAVAALAAVLPDLLAEANTRAEDAATQKEAFKAAVAVVGKTKQANTYGVGSLTGPIEPACTCTTEGDPT